MNRSRSFVAAQAIQEYVSVNEWQIAEITKGLAEADAGDFATEEELQRVFKKLIDNFLCSLLFLVENRLPFFPQPSSAFPHSHPATPRSRQGI